MKDIILIGSEGFTGQYTKDSLIKLNYSVLSVDQFNINESNFIRCDIRNKNEVRKLPIGGNTIVINLAARQYHENVPKRKDRKVFFFETNYIGTKNLLEVMVEKQCKNLIYFTTDMVYGKPQNIPVNEEHVRKPFGPYGISKVNSENLCDEYREKEHINITIFRPRMIMGPGRIGVLKKLFRLIELNLPVPMIGNGENYYQMIAVFDCVQAIKRAIEKNIPNENFNLGSKNPPSVKNLLKRLISEVNSKSVLLPIPGKLVKYVLNILDIINIPIMYPEQFMIADENYLLDINKAKKILEWEPQYSDQDMIVQAYQYYKNGKKKI